MYKYPMCPHPARLGPAPAHLPMHCDTSMRAPSSSSSHAPHRSHRPIHREDSALLPRSSAKANFPFMPEIRLVLAGPLVRQNIKCSRDAALMCASSSVPPIDRVSHGGQPLVSSSDSPGSTPALAAWAPLPQYSVCRTTSQSGLLQSKRGRELCHHSAHSRVTFSTWLPA